MISKSVNITITGTLERDWRYVGDDSDHRTEVYFKIDGEEIDWNNLLSDLDGKKIRITIENTFDKCE